MECHPTLSRNIPRIPTPRSHARTPSRAPTRNRLGDDLLSDLSPASTLEAFTSPSGKLKASIEAATPLERAFGIRAAVASKKVQEWVTELSDWPWPAGGGSLGFEMPAAKRRKLSNPFPESRTIRYGFEGNAEEDGDEPLYIGSLLAQDIKKYEIRIDEITEEMYELHVEDIKRQVLDTHFSPKSRPSSSASNAPMPSLFASYTKMDDFTAVVTAIVLQTLPNLSRLIRLMDVWNIRLAVLRKVPPLLGGLDDAEIALQSGWNSINNSGQGQPSRMNAEEKQTLTRKAFEAMMDVLQLKVSALGKDLDYMLDTLEGRPDTLPDIWLERMETIEKNYGEWAVAGDRKVREGEWAAMEKRREEEEARRFKEAEETNQKAKEAALEVARLQALRGAEEAEAARLEALREMEEAVAAAARLKAEHEAQEKARLKSRRDAEVEEHETREQDQIQALKDAGEAEATRLQAEHAVQERERLKALKNAEEAEAAKRKAEEDARDIARRKAEDALETARLRALIEAEEAARLKAEHEAQERARLKAFKDAEEAEAAILKTEKDALEAARIQALRDAEETEKARLQAEEESQEIVRHKAKEDALEAARLNALREAQEAEIARVRAGSEALEAARLKALKDAEDAEIARLRAQSEAAEAARLKALSDGQEAGSARLNAEGESREIARREVEVEAARVEVVHVKVQEEAAETKRLKIEHEARDAAQREAEPLLKEAQAAECVLQQAEEANLEAEQEAEMERLRIEHAAQEAVRIQAENDNLEASRLRAEQEARELAERIAEQEAITAKGRAEKDAEAARLRAELEAQETAERARIQVENHAESARIQAQRDIEDAARIKAEEGAEIARLQMEKDVADAALQKAKQKAEAAETVRRQFEEAVNVEIAEQNAAELAQQELERRVESNRIKAQKDIEDLYTAEALRQQVSDDAEIESSLLPNMEADITMSQPVQSTADGTIDTTKMSTAEIALAVGAGIAAFACLKSSKKEAVPMSTSPLPGNITSETLTCGCPAFDGTASKPCTPVDEVGRLLTHSHGLSTCESNSLTDETVNDGSNVQRCRIDSPVKLDILNTRESSTDSPIHLNEKTLDRDPSPSTSIGSTQYVDGEKPGSPQFAETFANFLRRSFSSPSRKVSPQILRTSHESLPEARSIEPDVRTPTSLHNFASPQRATISMFDGANESVESPRKSTGNGWVVINPSKNGSALEEDFAGIELNLMSDRQSDSPHESLADHKVTSIQPATSYSTSDPTPENQEAEPRAYIITPVLSPARSPCLTMNSEIPTTPSRLSLALPDSTPTTTIPNDLETPSNFAHSHEDLEELKDLEASILSPVPEETLMPSIEMDTADGSCDVCDAFDEDDEELENVSPLPTRKTSVAHINSGVRRISIQRRDSISSNISTIITGRVEDGPLSPVASPILDTSALEPFEEDVEQSPSAGRIGQRNRKSYDLSPPASPSNMPKLFKQRSLQILKTPGYSPSEPTTPSTPLEAPFFDNIDVTTVPLLPSPRKGNNDEQLQQQISSLLEQIPARIRLTSDQESVSQTAQRLRPTKTRRSVTPNFRPSSSMSNYSTYSRAPTPSFTLAPAFSKTTQRSRGSVGHPEIKLYHLSRSTGEAPIKLCVRLVGENGERVMVRVGGGWADLGEYLKEYASHHGRRTAADNGDKIEIQDLPPRVVSGTRVVSSSSTTSTVRGNGRSTPIGRPMSVMDNRPSSSLNIRKTRQSVGASESGGFTSRANGMGEDSDDPSTPLPANHRCSYQTPPSVTSIESSNASVTGTSAASGRSSRMEWTEEESSLGLAGPKAKKVIMSEKDQEWVESMKEKVKLASAEKERRNRERERLERERERKTSFGAMGHVGGTKRLFRKSLPEKIAGQKSSGV